MKALTTLTAVAALVVGMSIASAQTPSQPAQAPNATGMKAAPAANGKKSLVHGTGKFCSVSATDGKMNCKYVSVDACQKDPKLKGRPCVANPGSAGTTGSN